MGQITYFVSGLRIGTDQSDQWQPTLTAHDPNPPITLVNPGGDGTGSGGAGNASEARYFLAT